MTLSKTLLRNSTLAAGATMLLAGAPAFADHHKEDGAYKAGDHEIEHVADAKATLAHCREVAETCSADIDGAAGVLVFPEVWKADLIVGGAGGEGTNPEQMFAAGYAACYIGALKHVAAAEKVKLGKDISVKGEVGIGPIEGGFAIAVKLIVDLGELDKATAQSIADKAHQVCPYSNATRGNIEVDITVV